AVDALPNREAKAMKRAARWSRTSLTVAALVCAGLVASGGPTTAQAPRYEAIGSLPGPYEAMRAEGIRAYVAAGRTLTIYDLSTPTAPKRLGSHTFAEHVWSFRVVDSTAWVGVNFSGLAILDVSNGASPLLRGS